MDRNIRNLLSTNKLNNRYNGMVLTALIADYSLKDLFNFCLILSDR